MTHDKINPLLEDSPHRNQAIPFPDIEASHYIPALKTAIAKAYEKIREIKNEPNPADFSNTIEALEFCSEDVDLISRVFFNQLSANSTEALQQLAGEIGPILSDFSSDILLDGELFARVRKVYENSKNLNLDIEKQQLLEDTYTDFVRNGALLNNEQKERLRKIDARLSQLSPLFSENVLKATNAFEMFIDSPEKLKGLPESTIEAAAEAAKEKERSGQWLFTLQAPSLIPFLTFSEDREAREKIWRANAAKAFNSEFDNQQVVLELVRLKHERAQLLGFKDHADFVLRKRMAQNTAKVQSFLSELLEASVPAAQKDLKQVQDYADSLGGPNPLMPWDFAYYSEKLKESLFGLSDEKLRPYFKLENVIAGVFEHANKLFGLSFKSCEDYPLYHPDVKVYEVYDNDRESFVGVLYADFFPRASKRGGAWMTSYYEQGMFRRQLIRPHAAIVCNFTKPTTTKPSLLTFDEVSTLFHEFGHALHGLLSQCRYKSLSGTNVLWDFVELPSQLMENWILEKESLALFARHYETNEPLPEDLAQKIHDSARFLAGYLSLRQLSFSLLDMAWYTHPQPHAIEDVSAFERQIIEKLSVFPYIDGSNLSCSFNHIFGGGYSAGYYSYKWAEVLDADAFEFFKEKGLFNKDVASRFKDNILSRGGSEPPMELYKKFRGREPDPKALLRRDGLIEEQPQRDKQI